MRHHLIVLEHWDELCDYLTDFRCLDVRIRAGQVFALVLDHRMAISVLPEFEAEAVQEGKRVKICAEYGAALIAYASSSTVGNHSALPQPPLAAEVAAMGDIPEHWSTRAARLRVIANFLAQQVTLLAESPGDFLPLAANAADDGPLAEAAELANASEGPWLHRNPRPPSAPLRPQCIQILQGHLGEVTSVNLTPDGSRAVSGSRDRTLRIWDLQSGQCLHILEGHSGEVTGVSLTPDGSRAVSGSRDHTLRVWDLQSGQCLLTLQDHTGVVTGMSLTPDGTRAVSGGFTQTLRVWDLQSGQGLAFYHTRDKIMSHTPFSTGDRIVCSTLDGQMHFLTLRNFT